MFGVTSMPPASGWFQAVFRGELVVRKLLIGFSFFADFAEFFGGRIGQGVGAGARSE